MKIGKRSENKVRATKPDKNNGKKNLALIFVLAITAVLIVWVYSMGKKAEETVSVVMLAENVYKNEPISESVIKEYQMLKGEFEKYAVVDGNGNKRRRILLWNERNLILGSFAAYPLQTDTVAMFSDFVNSRTDNSDTILYSFPGKQVIRLDIGTSELKAFKTFLKPGDRVNITAMYSDKVSLKDEEEQSAGTATTYREEPVFTDIMLADLLNSSGESILDKYASYKEKTVFQQAALDASDSWQTSTTPATILVALTPEEVTRYYSYKSKSNVQFFMSLPQRVE